MVDFARDNEWSTVDRGGLTRAEARVRKVIKRPEKRFAPTLISIISPEDLPRWRPGFPPHRLAVQSAGRWSYSSATSGSVGRPLAWSQRTLQALFLIYWTTKIISVFSPFTSSFFLSCVFSFSTLQPDAEKSQFNDCCLSFTVTEM